MKMQTQRLIFSEGVGKLLLRIATGGLMIFHGVYKLIHGHDEIRFLLKNHGLPEFMTYGVPIGEVIAPVMILLGLFSRIASLFVAFTMVMSICLFYGTKAFLIDKYGGLNSQLNLFFLFASMAIFFLGSGKYSISKGKGKWD